MVLQVLLGGVEIPLDFMFICVCLYFAFQLVYSRQLFGHLFQFASQMDMDMVTWPIRETILALHLKLANIAGRTLNFNEPPLEAWRQEQLMNIMDNANENAPIRIVIAPANNNARGGGVLDANGMPPADDPFWDPVDVNNNENNDNNDNGDGQNNDNENAELHENREQEPVNNNVNLNLNREFMEPLIRRRLMAELRRLNDAQNIDNNQNEENIASDDEDAEDEIVIEADTDTGDEDGELTDGEEEEEEEVNENINEVEQDHNQTQTTVGNSFAIADHIMAERGDDSYTMEMTADMRKFRSEEVFEEFIRRITIKSSNARVTGERANRIVSNNYFIKHLLTHNLSVQISPIKNGGNNTHCITVLPSKSKRNIFGDRHFTRLQYLLKHFKSSLMLEEATRQAMGNENLQVLQRYIVLKSLILVLIGFAVLVSWIFAGRFLLGLVDEVGLLNVHKDFLHPSLISHLGLSSYLLPLGIGGLIWILIIHSKLLQKYNYNGTVNIVRISSWLLVNYLFVVPAIGVLLHKTFGMFIDAPSVSEVIYESPNISPILYGAIGASGLIFQMEIRKQLAVTFNPHFTNGIFRLSTMDESFVARPKISPIMTSARMIFLAFLIFGIPMIFANGLHYMIFGSVFKITVPGLSFGSIFLTCVFARSICSGVFGNGFGAALRSDFLVRNLRRLGVLDLIYHPSFVSDEQYQDNLRESTKFTFRPNNRRFTLPQRVTNFLESHGVNPEESRVGVGAFRILMNLGFPITTSPELSPLSASSKIIGRLLTYLTLVTVLPIVSGAFIFAPIICGNIYLGFGNFTTVEAWVIGLGIIMIAHFWVVPLTKRFYYGFKHGSIINKIKCIVMFNVLNAPLVFVYIEMASFSSANGYNNLDVELVFIAILLTFHKQVSRSIDTVMRVMAPRDLSTMRLSVLSIRRMIPTILMLAPFVAHLFVRFYKLGYEISFDVRYPQATNVDFIHLFPRVASIKDDTTETLIDILIKIMEYTYSSVDYISGLDIIPKLQLGFIRVWNMCPVVCEFGQSPLIDYEMYKYLPSDYVSRLGPWNVTYSQWDFDFISDMFSGDTLQTWNYLVLAVVVFNVLYHWVTEYSKFKNKELLDGVLFRQQQEMPELQVQEFQHVQELEQTVEDLEEVENNDTET
eukprot:TRINITY_DN277_c2_g1_i1.p1 TRINITY_DN277_c2_g1~~TRINITY_DN277_c2_g1_i1.p1  ORF type:complete len:1250 (-),score=305.63 TRINITY_DN277_c2_g1_i1:113-3544(-)